MISAVVPSFNTPDLGKAIDSILHQTLPVKEVIVVDDASTDPSYLEKLNELEKKYAPVLKIIRLMENRGPAYARNQGWDHATGQWVAFLDADDRWAPEKIERQIQFMSSRPDTMISCHWTDYQSYRFQGNVRPQDGLLRNFLSPCCTMVRRDLPIRFDPQFRYCEDHEFLIRAAREYQIEVFPEVLTHLGHIPSLDKGLSSHRWKMRKAQIKIYWRLWQLNELGTWQMVLYSALALSKHIVKEFKAVLRGKQKLS